MEELFGKLFKVKSDVHFKKKTIARYYLSLGVTS